jgi:LacI family transcriptional regulator
MVKVTLHEVATHAGVSIATASRALNGLAVSEHAEARVRQAAAELGYVANAAARSLRSERTMTMGLVFHDLRNTLGIQLTDALGEAVEAAGYSLLIASARADAGRYDRLLRRFLERRVDALFCINPRGDGGGLAGYAATGTPVISLFEADAAFGGLPRLTPTFARSAAALAQHLKGLGHEHVGVLLDRARPHPLLAAMKALKAAGLRVGASEHSEAGGMRDVIETVMSKADRPTALIALDPKARGLQAACQAAGLAVPGDLSIVGVREFDARRRRGDSLSALVVDPRHMGAAAAAAMLGWLSGVRPPDLTRVEAGEFEPRATTGPARADWRVLSA